MDNPEIMSPTASADQLQQRLDSLAATGTGSSNRLLRIAVETEPATLDSGELTPKSALSPATVLRRRADTVAALFEPSPGARILCARLP